MAGTVGHQAEIAGSAHNAGAEMMLPDAVDHHAGRERVAWIRDRLRQFQAAAAFVEWNRGAVAQDTQKAPRNGIAEIVRISAKRLLQVRRVVDIRDNVQERIALRQVLL